MVNTWATDSMWWVVCVNVRAGQNVLLPFLPHARALDAAAHTLSPFEATCPLAAGKLKFEKGCLAL